MLAAMLAVIPVQEEERERAHDEEEEDPYPEASVVFDGLVIEVRRQKKILLIRFIHSDQRKT